MIESCALCGGAMKRKYISLDLRTKGKLRVFENVPALTCRKCGEVVLSPKTTAKIEKLLVDKDTQCKTIHVPVYDLKSPKQ